MDNFEKRDLDEDNFGAKGSVVAAFDAFPKSKPQYVTRTEGGGKWTVAMAVVSLFLLWAELASWWRGSESHTFAVEQRIAHAMQINLDAVVLMKCGDLHVNVQDAAGDLILAGAKLRKDETSWAQWVNQKGVHKLGRDSEGRIVTGAGWESLDDEGFGEEHVHDIVALGKKRAKWAKTPRVRGPPDSCRIYGSLELNKVQGDFHITARGHGYRSQGGHLDHNSFNFSHIINELSFGAYYPSLVNPLDHTINTAEDHFQKFQYYVSVVPTQYSVGSSTIAANQYAVTEQTKVVSEYSVPGVFVKYDIEPIQLSVVESRDGFFKFCFKLINVLSGVLVAGHWGFTLSEWLREVLGKRRRQSGGEGFLGTKHGFND
ncbi:hypothetical protein E4U57_004558 [Claviceps arundinis]|uniref:Endoplasmic reticulum-Golgi intermediate compartment protein n=1 Tax=Claviceps arundinis TaxID=1623583 RepID=A0A9P7MS78_9HYPO|nr:hypothetical protein E4U57_004558 [Claviceps arundinis]KAG5965697.1 hypothetical protein E4U56_001601 [Claviceps arundinis]